MISVDWWSYGCILYELFCGQSPFFSSSMTITCQKIIERDIYWPQELPDDAKDLVDKLLQVDLKKRLGCGKANSSLAPEKIRSHKFFEGIRFADLRKMDPPIEMSDCKFEGPRGTGINMAMYAYNGTRHSSEDEEIIINSRMVPLTNNHDDGAIVLNLTEASIMESIRRSEMLRPMYPELKKLPNRPLPLRIHSIVEEQNHPTSERKDDDTSDPPEPNIVDALIYIQTIANLKTPIQCIEWSNTDKIALSGNFSMKCYGIESSTQMNATQMKVLQSEETTSGAFFLKYSSNGKYLAYDMKREIGLVKQKGQKKTTNTWSSVPHASRALVGHRLPITTVAWADDSVALAAGGLDSSVYLWNAKTKTCNHTFKNVHSSYISAIEWQNKLGSSNLPLLASSGGDGRIAFYDVNTTKVVKKIDHIHDHKSILGIHWSPSDSKIIASHALDRKLVFIDSSSNCQITQMFVHPTPVLKIEWSLNGRYLAAVHKDVIRIWDTVAMKILKTIPREGNQEDGVTVSSANGSGNVSGGVNTTLISFDHTSSQLACTIGNYDRIPIVYELSADRFLTAHNTTTHKAPITALKWANNKPILATGSFDHTVILWGLDQEHGDADEDTF
jgi:WD40 repeat protein